jgi:Holliday junction DNA helicase RuvA
MIGRLTGKLLGKEPPLLWLDVGGIGYECEAPLSTFYKLPEVGQALSVHTHLIVREDSQTLVAFASAAEKALFRQLIKLSGVGPKSALTILSGISVDDFWDTVRAQDAAKLTRLPGIGKKTAERLVLELKDKAGEHTTTSKPAGTDGAVAQAVSALVNLGYKPAEAQRLADAAYRAGDPAEQVIREALKRALR